MPDEPATTATTDLAEVRAHADRLADCLEALVRNRKPHTYWLDEGLDALIAYRDQVGPPPAPPAPPDGVGVPERRR